MGLACLYYLFLFVLMDSAASDLIEDINSCCDSDESRDASDSNSHDPREWSVDSSENEGFGVVMAWTCLSESFDPSDVRISCRSVVLRICSWSCVLKRESVVTLCCCGAMVPPWFAGIIVMNNAPSQIW